MNIADIDFREWEPVLEPAPTNATPREFALWAAGRDFEELRNPVSGQDWTWQELREAGMDQIVAEQLARITQLSTKPIIRLRKKSQSPDRN